MIRLDNIHIEYQKLLLKKESITIPRGQVTLIVGDSGIGKTSLLYRIALIQKDCDYYYDNIYISEQKEKEICDFIREKIGFVLQENDIIAHLNVKENIEHYGLLTGKIVNEEEITSLLKMVRLEIPLHQETTTLSLGQKQRLCIACALVKDPDLLIFDEPSASLDNENEDIIFQIIKDLAYKKNKHIVLSSHSEKAVYYADRIYAFKDKHIELIQSIEIKESKEHSVKKLLYKYFYRNYVKTFTKKYKFKYLLLMLVMSIILLLSCFTSVYLEFKTNTQEEILYSQFDKRLFITKHSKPYIIENSIYMPTDNLKSNEFPVRKITLTNFPKICIIPYYDNNKFEEKLGVTLGGTDTNGVYFSYDTYRLLQQEFGRVENKMILPFTIHGIMQEQEINIEIQSEIIISGSFKQGVFDYYNDRSNTFIYMYYEDIENIFSDYQLNDYMIGKDVFYQDYEELKVAKKQYEDQEFYVNDDNIDITAIDDIVSYYKNLQLVFISLIWAVGLIVLIIININLFYKRKKELAILKINGLSNKEIHKIISYEYLLIISIPLIISSIFMLLAIYIINIPIFYIVMLFLYVLTVYIILYLLYTFLIKRINVEKILRN